MKIARITIALFATSLLAISTMGCDGAAHDTTTTTQALTAELSADRPTATFDVVFEISEPTAANVDRFNRAIAPTSEADRFEAVVDSVGTIGDIADASDVAQMFSAAVQAVANDSEYVGEREAADALEAPIFAEIPSFSCEGSVPCIVRLRVVFERLDFTHDEPIAVNWSAWAGMDSHAIEVLEVVDGADN